MKEHLETDITVDEPQLFTICDDCPCLCIEECAESCNLSFDCDHNRVAGEYHGEYVSEKWVIVSTNCKLKSISYGDSVFTPIQKKLQCITAITS